MKRKNVSLADFVAVVMRAAVEGWNQADVARELGVTGAAVSLRLKSLREKGVRMPDLTGWVDERESPANRLASAFK